MSRQNAVASAFTQPSIDLLTETMLSSISAPSETRQGGTNQISGGKPRCCCSSQGLIQDYQRIALARRSQLFPYFGRGW